MKVILYMAQTVNGIIARENFEEDFLSNENWKVSMGLINKYKCFIIGRKTYEEVKKWKDFNFDDIKSVKIVVSRDNNFRVDKSYLIASSPQDAMGKANKLGFKKIILTGGGSINSSFMKAGLIDEIIVNIEPFVLGKGVKIFSEENFENKLKLLKIKKLKSGIVQLHYKVTTT